MLPLPPDCPLMPVVGLVLTVHEKVVPVKLEVRDTGCVDCPEHIVCAVIELTFGKGLTVTV